jgi:hypothetical protein
MAAGAELFLKAVGAGVWATLKNIWLLNSRLTTVGLLLKNYENRAIKTQIQLARVSQVLADLPEKIELVLYRKGLLKGDVRGDLSS